MPKVSVIIPVYNVEPYLERCLDSVINQTLKDIEIICINDCSTDGSLAILQKYAEKDKRIKLIDLPENRGAGYAKNLGLEVAKGEYLGFVDPDDTIDLNFYEELYKKASENNTDIVKCELITIETDGTKRKSNLNNLISAKSKFYFAYEYTSAIYKTSLIKKNNITFPQELLVGEDVVFLHNAVIKANLISIANNTKYYYVRRKNSLNIPVYDIDRMYSSIKTIEYMADNYNDALKNNDISKEVYLLQYSANIFSLLEFTQTKTNKKELKLKCAEKFIELFNKCQLKSELENYISRRYKKILVLIKNNETNTLLEICIKYKNIQNFCMIERLKNNVHKDFNNAKIISNNTSV